jgi:hypothetical protein
MVVTVPMTSNIAALAIAMQTTRRHILLTFVIWKIAPHTFFSASVKTPLATLCAVIAVIT